MGLLVCSKESRASDGNDDDHRQQDQTYHHGYRDDDREPRGHSGNGVTRAQDRLGRCRVRIKRERVVGANEVPCNRSRIGDKSTIGDSEVGSSNVRTTGCVDCLRDSISACIQTTYVKLIACRINERRLVGHRLYRRYSAGTC